MESGMETVCDRCAGPLDAVEHADQAPSGVVIRTAHLRLREVHRRSRPASRSAEGRRPASIAASAAASGSPPSARRAGSGTVRSSPRPRRRPAGRGTRGATSRPRSVRPQVGTSARTASQPGEASQYPRARSPAAASRLAGRVVVDVLYPSYRADTRPGRSCLRACRCSRHDRVRAGKPPSRHRRAPSAAG